MIATQEYQKKKTTSVYTLVKESSIEAPFLRSSVKNDFTEWFVELFAKKPPSGQELWPYLEN